MHDIVHLQLLQSNSYAAQLAEQFERIDKIIDGGGTATLILAGDGRSISLRIDRDDVVASELPVGPRPPRETRPPFDNDSLVALATNSFGFDVDDINRRVTPGDVAARISQASGNRPGDKPERGTDAPTGAGVTPPGVPRPAVTFDGETWLLVGDCVYTTDDGFTLTARSGFETDLASIPRILWLAIAPHELSLAAPIFHDLLYRAGGEVGPPTGEVAPAGRVFTRREADDLFLELMTRAAVPKWKRKAAYHIVDYFAGYAWRGRLVK